MSSLIRYYRQQQEAQAIANAHQQVADGEKNVYEAAATLPCSVQQDFINSYLEDAGLMAGYSHKTGFARCEKQRKNVQSSSYVREANRKYGRTQLS